MKEHGGSAERWRGKRGIVERMTEIDGPETEVLNPSITDGIKRELSKTEAAEKKFKKALEAYFQICSDGEVLLNQKDREIISKRAEIILSIFLKVEARYHLTREETLRLLGKVCRTGIVNVGKGKKYTNDETLGRDIMLDITRHVAWQDKHGISIASNHSVPLADN